MRRTLGLRRRWSFRTHVVALVITSVLPLVGLGVYSMIQMSEGQRTVDRAEIISTARAISSIIDQRLDDNLNTLRALARQFPGPSGSLEEFYGDCVAHAAENGGSILLADLTGQQIFNSKRPLGAPLPHVAGTPEFWQLIASGETAIGNAYTSSVDGTASFALLAPVIQDGRIVAVLGMTFPTQTLNDLLARQRLSADWTLGAVDRTGTIFARHNGDGSVVGMKASSEVMAMPPEQDGALFELQNRQGVLNYMGVARSALSGWRVVVGIPSAVVEAPLHRSLRNFALLGGGVLLLALGAASLIGGRLASNMKTLARVAHALPGHEPLPAVETTVSEIYSMASALGDARSELAQSDGELRRSREHLLRAQRIGRVGSIERDLETGSMVCSDEAFRLFGVERGSFVPSIENLVAMVHPDDREKLRQATTQNGGATQPIEYRVVRPDGVERVIYREAEATYDETGRPVGAFIIIRDVTDLRAAEEGQRELERQLQHSQKLEALGTLAGGIAHDLNNTLVPVLGLGKTTLLRLQEGSREHANLAVILQAGERARDLVRQILAFIRKEGPSREAFEIVLVARDALMIARASIPATIRLIEALERVPPLLGDAGQLHQVIINLVVNAAQAIGDAVGAITVALAIDEAPLRDASGPSVSAIRLSVSDTGCGIDAATLARIFEPFFTTKPVGEGTGLGLSMVHGIVAQHGGRIAVESRVGQGTRFDIFLPPLARKVEAFASVTAAT